MSGAPWRSVFSFNKYTQIAADALRRALHENVRVEALKRGATSLRYQQWENGLGGIHTPLKPPPTEGKGA